MGRSGKFSRAMERYFTEFEAALADEGILEEPSQYGGHPILDLCLGFDQEDFSATAPREHTSFKVTRVDRIVREVFSAADLYRSYYPRDQTTDNEVIVDGFPTSFWLGFENPMLSVLFSTKSYRKRRRFNFTKKHRTRRNNEQRRRRTIEGRILTSSLVLLRNSASFNSSFSASNSRSTTNSDWMDDQAIGEATAAVHQYYQQQDAVSLTESVTESDTESEGQADVNRESSAESIQLRPAPGRLNHMDDGLGVLRQQG